MRDDGNIVEGEQWRRRREKRKDLMKSAVMELEASEGQEVCWRSKTSLEELKRLEEIGDKNVDLTSFVSARLSEGCGGEV